MSKVKFALQVIAGLALILLILLVFIFLVALYFSGAEREFGYNDNTPTETRRWFEK